MINQVTGLYAYVAHPNTPQSDLLPEVLCVVHGMTDTGALKQITLMAQCPQTAIELARKIEASRWQDALDSGKRDPKKSAEFL